MISKALVFTFIFKQKWGWHQQKTNETVSTKAFIPVDCSVFAQRKQLLVFHCTPVYIRAAHSLSTLNSHDFAEKNKVSSLGGDAVSRVFEYFRDEFFLVVFWLNLLIRSFITDLLRNKFYAGSNNEVEVMMFIDYRSFNSSKINSR